MFCKFCGKEIPEGGTCTCEQSASPVAVQAPPAAAGNDAGKAVGDAFKGMPAASKQLLANTSGAGMTLPSAIIFAGIGLIAHILAWICIVGGLIGGLKDSMGVMGAMAGEYIDKMFKGVYGSAIWGGCVSYVLPLAVMLVIMVVGQLVRKEKVDILPGFITAASVSVVPSAIFLVAGLISMLIPDIAAFLILIAVMAGIVVFVKLLAKQFKSTDSALNSLLVAVILTVIVAVIAWAVVGVITGYFKGAFAENMGGMIDLEDLLGLLTGNF
ncbi:MAG: hypothetical protein J6Q53_02470 [Oscillospiraceae bacterium]|nr:hypothetical protein [Oscillospiraceae bacterium]